MVKKIAFEVAQKLNINYYDKEEIKDFALNHNYAHDFTEKDLYDNFLSLDANKDAIIHQSTIIKQIAQEEDCVIVGRAADYILKDNPNLIRIFLYALMDYKIENLKLLYNDSEKEAKKNIIKSTESRASYYEVISNQKWGDKANYDICLNCEIGNDKIIQIIYDYINCKK